MIRKLFGLIVLLLIAGTTVHARHSFSAEFDNKKPVKVTGKIVKVESMNPFNKYSCAEKNRCEGNCTPSDVQK